MRKLIGCIVILLLLSLFACKRAPVDKAEIPGTYGARMYRGTEELILRPDGTFDEKFTYDLDPSGHFGSPTAATYENSGRWRYSLENGESFVLLGQALISPFSEPPNKHDWRLKAYSPAGRGVVLDWEDPDRHVKLNKIE